MELVNQPVENMEPVNEPVENMESVNESVENTESVNEPVGILAYDSSGSTRGCPNYYEKVESLMCSGKYKYFISWSGGTPYASSEAKIHQLFDATRPATFLDLLKANHEVKCEPFQQSTTFFLTIVTDGWICQSDVDACIASTRYLTPYIEKVTIFYIGNESSMNVGLNVIMNSVNNLSFHINDEVFTLRNTLPDNLSDENFLFEVAHAVSKAKDNENEMKRIRSHVMKLPCADKERELEVNNQFEEACERGDEKEAVKILRQSICDNLQAVKNKAISIIDNKSTLLGLNDLRLVNNCYVSNEEVETSMSATCDVSNDAFECKVMYDISKHPCYIIVKPSQPVIQRNCYSNPFAILGNDDVIKRIEECIEQNEIDFSTYVALQNSNQTTTSPFTRRTMEGVFYLFATDHAMINRNCKAISAFFSCDGTMPNKLKLWNFVFTVIIYRLIERDSSSSSKVAVLKNHLVSYIENTRMPLNDILPRGSCIKSSMKHLLWFLIFVMPQESPNSTFNLLREPAGLTILKIYKLLDLHVEDTARMFDLCNTWQSWNFLVRQQYENKRKEFLKMVIAQYQNYQKVGDTIVLLSGACKRPYPCALNETSPRKLLGLIGQLKKGSKKLANDVDFDAEEEPKPVVVDEVNNDDIDHVQICEGTCRPYYICPVSNLPWNICAERMNKKQLDNVEQDNLRKVEKNNDTDNGEQENQLGYLQQIQNIQKDGVDIPYFEMFGKYCEKYKRYPEMEEFVSFIEERCPLNVYQDGYIENVIIRVMKAFEKIRKCYRVELFIERRILTLNKDKRRELELDEMLQAAIRSDYMIPYFEMFWYFCEEYKRYPTMEEFIKFIEDRNQNDSIEENFVTKIMETLAVSRNSSAKGDAVSKDAVTKVMEALAIANVMEAFKKIQYCFPVEMFLHSRLLSICKNKKEESISQH